MASFSTEGQGSAVSDNGQSSSSTASSEKTKRKGWNLGTGFEEWGGYMNAKKQKLADQFNKDRPRGEGYTDIFNGVSIHVNGYTNPSSDELKRLMLRHGGNYETYMSKTHVTHVIATRLPDSKVREIKSGDKIVKPQWILDSIAAGKLLSYEPYQLYTAQSSLQKGMGRFTTPIQKTSGYKPLQTASTMTDAMKIPLPTASTMTETLWSEPLGNIQDGGECRDMSVRNQPIDGESSLNHSSLQMDSDENLFDNDTLEMEISKENVSDMTVKKGPENTNPHVTLTAQNKSNKNLPSHKNYQGASRSIPTSVSDFTNTNPPITAQSEPKEISPSHKNYHGTSRSIPTSSDSTFVSDFYTHSRLHHLSTWKSEFAEYVNQLQLASEGVFPGRDKLIKYMTESSSLSYAPRETTLNGKPPRVIMHVDMDCFFVSVGVRERPELQGKPIAVTHSKGKGTKPTPGSNYQLERGLWESGRSKRGKQSTNGNTSTNFDDEENDFHEEAAKSRPHITAILSLSRHGDMNAEEFYSMAEIASCSYEARKAGVKNGMFMGGAKKLCPDLVTIPYDFDKYNEVSRQLYDIVASYTHDIEAVSCDEMLIDCTDLLANTGASPLQFATVLRLEIFEKTSCAASVGLGPNILLAKMATRQAKPDGQFYLESGEVKEFISPQLVKDLPGIGWAMTKRLATLNIKTCADMQMTTLATLQKEFGPKIGQSLYRFCRGIDDRPIKVEKERKSVSAEINYGIRFKKDDEAVKFLTELSEEVHNRLEKIHSKGKSITLKLKVRREDAPVETAKFLGHGICNTVTKSATLPMATDNPKIITKEVLTILRGLKVDVIEIRGVGIQVQKLESSVISSSRSSKGHGSILNFVVPKTSLDKPDPQSPVTTDTQVTDHSSTGVNTTVHVINKEVNQPCELSNSQLTTPRMFYPGHLENPPLPLLPNFTSPELRSSPVLLFKSPEPQKNTTSEDYLPSPSQIDVEVLKELPDDIREQIETAMRERGRSKTAVNHFIQKPITNKQTEAGCSHWVNPNLTSSDRNKSVDLIGLNIAPPPMRTEDTPDKSTENSDIVPLPSPSQIDLECLQALPEELQLELQQAYAVQNKQQQQKEKSKTVPQKMSGWSAIMAAGASSPSKKKSPSKKGRLSNNRKKSPHFKIPRGQPGRKKRHNPKKLDFTPVSSAKPSQPVENEQVILVNINDIETDVQNDNPSPSEITEVTEGREAERETTHVNLCGRVTLSDVRSLLRLWLQSGADPENQDVSVIAQYLAELVLDKNLEFVDLILKFLKRQVSKLTSTGWSDALQNIVSSTQGIIFSCYGSYLKGFSQ